MDTTVPEIAENEPFCRSSFQKMPEIGHDAFEIGENERIKSEDSMTHSVFIVENIRHGRKNPQTLVFSNQGGVTLSPINLKFYR